MSNKGRHTNTSQFYITFDECKWLNGKHVVFGTVVDGLRTLRAIEDAGSPDGQPLCSIQIVDCGEL
jgi:peptidylprolyl isomerase